MSEIEPNKQAAEEWLKTFVAEESVANRLSMLGGAVLRLALNVADLGAKHLGELIQEAEKGLSEVLAEAPKDQIEDAKILAEYEDDSDEKAQEKED